MRRRFVPIVILGLVATASIALSAQSPSSGASPIDGVWRITEIVTTGANAATITSPQPSLVIFTRGHYSYVSVNGPQPRLAVNVKDPNKLTDAEKIATFEQWNPFTAQSGTYQIKGATLVRRPVVAKNVTVMTTNPPIEQDFKLDGTTLWLTTKSAAGQPVSETRTTLTRVQ